MRTSTEIHTHGKFMTGVGVGKLKKLYKKAKGTPIANRILACIKRKKGMSIPDIADLLEVPYSTVYRWLAEAARAGVSSFDRSKTPGAKCRLTDDQCTELYEMINGGAIEQGFVGDAWTARRAIAVVKKKFKIEYGARGMQLLLHRIGFACKVPRPRHPKAATEKEKVRFKRSVAAIRGHRKGWSVCMIDSASLISGWNAQRSWYPVGVTKFTPATLSRKRTHILGALYDGEVDAVFCDKVDSAEFEKFLRRQLDHKKAVIAILDNASAHHAGNIGDLVEEFKGRLVLVYLPPYTPELNSIELLWRAIRKAIANATFDSAAALKKAVRRALLGSDALIVPIAEYAKDKKAPRAALVHRQDRQRSLAGPVLSLIRCGPGRACAAKRAAGPRPRAARRPLRAFSAPRAPCGPRAAKFGSQSARQPRCALFCQIGAKNAALGPRFRQHLPRILPFSNSPITSHARHAIGRTDLFFKNLGE